MLDGEPDIEEAERQRGTVKKSMAAIASRWLRRKTSHRWMASVPRGRRGGTAKRCAPRCRPKGCLLLQHGCARVGFSEHMGATDDGHVRHGNHRHRWRTWRRPLGRGRGLRGAGGDVSRGQECHTPRVPPGFDGARDGVESAASRRGCPGRRLPSPLPRAAPAAPRPQHIARGARPRARAQQRLRGLSPPRADARSAQALRREAAEPRLDGRVGARQRDEVTAGDEVDDRARGVPFCQHADAGRNHRPRAPDVHVHMG